MNRRVRGLIFVVYVLVFSFLAGEVVVRAMYKRFRNYNLEMWRYASELKQSLPNERLPFHHRPMKEGHYYGVDIKINSLGFRDREYTVPKPDGRTRIIFLGDSFTLGWGVPFEKTYSKRLEQMLNGGGDDYEVINMGIGNFNSVMEAELFKQTGLELDPDMVILMFFLNDTEAVPKRRPKLAEAFIRNSYFYAFLFGRYVRLRSRFAETFDWESYYRELYSDENSDSRAAATSAIRDLIALCQGNDIEILIVNIPELRELEDYEFAYATEYIEGLADEGGVDFIDMLPHFRSSEPESLWVSPEDPHANARANGIIARCIYDRMQEDGILQ